MCGFKKRTGYDLLGLRKDRVCAGKKRLIRAIALVL
jgi:hypothetical protein